MVSRSGFNIIKQQKCNERKILQIQYYIHMRDLFVFLSFRNAMYQKYKLLIRKILLYYN